MGTCTCVTVRHRYPPTSRRCTSIVACTSAHIATQAHDLWMCVYARCTVPEIKGLISMSNLREQQGGAEKARIRQGRGSDHCGECGDCCGESDRPEGESSGKAIPACGFGVPCREGDKGPGERVRAMGVPGVRSTGTVLSPQSCRSLRLPSALLRRAQNSSTLYSQESPDACPVQLHRNARAHDG